MKVNYKQPKFDPQTGEINPYMIDLKTLSNDAIDIFVKMKKTKKNLFFFSF
jgi:hypothetical protein